MGITVSAPLDEDRPSLEQILTACGTVFSPEETAVAIQMIGESMNGEYTILAATLDGETAGYCIAGRTQFTESTWDLYWLCVHPEKQRCGVARALLAAVQDIIRGAGGQRVVVETGGRADYAPARRFYRAAGFSEAGSIADYYRNGDACIYFCKVLS